MSLLLLGAGKALDAVSGSKPTLNTGGEPFLALDASDPTTPVTEIIVGWTYFINFGDWTNSPTGAAWAIYNDADDTLMFSGSETSQGEDGVIFSDEQATIVPRLETTASNGSGNALSAAVTVLPAVDDIGSVNTIEPDPITAYTRTSASGVTPMTVEITYASNVREGMTRRWNRYSDSAKSNLLATATHILTWEDLQTAAPIDLDAELGSYDVTDWIETGVEVTSPAAVWHSFTFADALSPTDAVVPMTLSTTDKTSNATLSGGALTITETLGGSNFGSVRASRAVADDLTYWEVSGNSGVMEYGVCDGGVALPSGVSTYWGLTAFGQVATSHAVGWQGNDSQIYYNNTNTTVTTFSASDVIQICWDRVNELFWARKNNTGDWNNNPSANPATGAGGFSATGLDSDHFPFVTAGPGKAATVNFGPSFTYTPPAGFVAP